MSISFQLEDELENSLRQEMGDLGLAARNALLAEAYRARKISIGRLARTLGIGVVEADEWLAKRGIPLNYDVADFEADVKTIERMGV